MGEISRPLDDTLGNWFVWYEWTLLTAEDVRFFCDLNIFKIFVHAVFEAMRSKDNQDWILRLPPQNFAIISKRLAANLEKVRQTSVWQTETKFWSICLFYCSSKPYSCKYCKNQNFGTICHTEVGLTFLRMEAKLSEMIAKFRGHSLKIQPPSSFDLNDLKSGTPKYFENSLKSLQIFQILMVGMNFWERSQKNQTSSAVRSVKKWYF